MTITILNVQNPAYSRADNSTIDVTVITAERGTIPFTANPKDPEPHGVQLYNDLIAGKYGTISPYIPPSS